MPLINPNLITSGRAHSPGRYWTAEEWAAVCLLTKECMLERPLAADYVRNGITTVEGYQKAVKSKFTPQTLEDAEKEVSETMKAKGAKVVGEARKKESKSKKKTK